MCKKVLHTAAVTSSTSSCAIALPLHAVTAVDETYVIFLNRVSHLMYSGITITKLPQGNYFESIRHTNMVWQKPIKDKNEEKRQKNK